MPNAGAQREGAPGRGCHSPDGDFEDLIELALQQRCLGTNRGRVSWLAPAGLSRARTADPGSAGPGSAASGRGRSQYCLGPWLWGQVGQSHPASLLGTTRRPGTPGRLQKAVLEGPLAAPSGKAGPTGPGVRRLRAVSSSFLNPKAAAVQSRRVREDAPSGPSRLHRVCAQSALCACQYLGLHSERRGG